jgi:hypothetical protein
VVDTFIAAGLLVFAVLNVWRMWVLGGPGGEGGSMPPAYLTTYLDGWYAPLFAPVRLADPRWKWLFAALSALLLAGGALALLRRHRTPATILMLHDTA